jgi:Cu(I)/Ag(I) efflux system membrane fusion protein
MGLGVAITLGVKHLKVFAAKPDAMAAAQQNMADAEPKVLYWYDPMVPAQRFDKPGKSPFMDMELVPKYAESGAATNTLTVDPAQVQNLGMRKAKVMRMPLHPQHDLPGTLRFNERNQAIIQLRAGGFVEKAWPLAPGDRVTAGQPIATFYVPEWLNTQNELLAAKTLNSPRLLETLRTRLRLLGMPDALIVKTEESRKPETRVTITAPINGVIESLEIKTGMSMASGQTLARITSIDSLWLDVAIPEAEASSLHAGDAAMFYAANANSLPVTGKIDSLLPAVNASTRTITARVVLPNPKGILKPGTSGRVVLSGNQTPADLQLRGLLVPTEAVIRTGKRSLVMVADTENHFRPVAVTLGQEIGDQTVVINGLEEGQEVVTSGQFLLDSEASLLGIESSPLTSTSAVKSDADTMPDMNDMPISNADISQAGIYQATARIVSINATEVGLDHGDFINAASKKVAMPAMTMSYTLANPALAKGHKVGDSVRVNAREIDGGLVVEQLETLTAPGTEMQP